MKTLDNKINKYLDMKERRKVFKQNIITGTGQMHIVV